jgi:hypothetical protein
MFRVGPTVADETEERIHLSAAQVAASSAAAVTAAVICSFFGVAGTVIGTAVASVMATVGSALYSYSLRRTKAKLRRLHQAGAASPPLTEVMRTAREQGLRLWQQMPLRILAIGAVGVFVVSTAVITGIELGVGKPLAAVFGVGHSGSRGTSVGSDFGIGPHRKSKSKSPTPKSSSASPSSSSSPPSSPPATHTSTPPPTPTVTPTQTPSNILSTLLSSRSPKS